MILDILERCTVYLSHGPMPFTPPYHQPRISPIHVDTAPSWQRPANPKLALEALETARKRRKRRRNSFEEHETPRLRLLTSNSKAPVACCSAADHCWHCKAA